MKLLAPHNIADLQQALKELTPEAVFLAGGTDIIIELHTEGAEQGQLLYLGYAKELAEIAETDDEITIGAMATMKELEQSPIVRKYLPALVDAAKDLGSVQIRNKATLGGNIANGSPAADTLPVLWLYRTVVEIMTPAGITKTPIDEFLKGANVTALKHNHAIVRFVIAKEQTGKTSAFVKIGSRRKVTISRLSMAIKQKEGKCLELVIGSILPTPVFSSFELTLDDISSEKAILEIGAKLLDYILEVNKRSNRKYKAWAAKGAFDDLAALLKERLKA